MTIALLCLVGLLAYANGANDNGKGVATLVGFGVARPRQALIWATATTAIGGAVSYVLAAGLLKSFSGGWLFHSGIALDLKFYTAVLIGSCGWVLLATRTGMPVSTTHAIVGSLCGAGLVAFGHATFEWRMLGSRFAVPLALGPVVSLAVVYVLAWPVVFVASRVVGRCVCVEREVAVTVGGTMALGGPSVVVAEEKECATAAVAVTASSTVNAVHWLSGGLISFARGWNDTPKIAAMSLLALAGIGHGKMIAFVIVTVAMAAGGLIAGRRVLETMSKKLTPLPLAESLTASLVTAALVSAASWLALPMSTTHVSTGAIIGAGSRTIRRT